MSAIVSSYFANLISAAMCLKHEITLLRRRKFHFTFSQQHNNFLLCVSEKKQLLSLRAMRCAYTQINIYFYLGKRENEISKGGKK